MKKNNSWLQKSYYSERWDTKRALWDVHQSVKSSDYGYKQRTTWGVHDSVAPLCGGTGLQGSANLCVAVRVDPKTPNFSSKDQPEHDMRV